MPTQLVCECGFEISDVSAAAETERRCPRCGRRVYADEAEAEAAFDHFYRDDETREPTGIETPAASECSTQSLQAHDTPSDDPDVTLDLSQPDSRNGSATADFIDNEASTPHPGSRMPDIKNPAVPASADNPFANQSPPPSAKPASVVQDLTTPTPRGSRVNLTERVMRPIRKPSVSSRDNNQSAGHFGIHRVIRVHQKGGMGRILVAYDKYLKREVALKELHPEVAQDDSIVRRFVGEAEITAQLEHPGVVPVHFLGLDDEGLPYYTMKMVRGETLQEAIREYHRKPSRTGLRMLVRRLVSASKTIAFAHSKGVIHRDLKPANIMTGEHGETLVMDWGLAKPFSRADQESYVSCVNSSVGSRPELTMVGAVVGTPAFMSPEQASANEAMIGPLSDVFALGTVLYYLLAGQTAFAGRSTLEVLSKVRAANPQRPSTIKPNVPSALEEVCLKAMAKEPHNRYQGAQEFVDDLCRWLDNEPVLAQKETLLQHLGRLVVRHKTFSFSLPLIMLVTVLLVYAGIQIGHHSVAESKKAVMNTILYNPEDLLEFPDEVKIEGSRGMSLRLGSRQSIAGRILTCQSEADLKEKHRTVIMHAPAGTAWNVTGREAFVFSLFEGQTHGANALQNFSVRLGHGSSYFGYKMNEAAWNDRQRGNWFSLAVPLAEGDENWTREVVGVPSLKSIDWIEFNFDVNAPVTVSFDNILFQAPTF